MKFALGKKVASALSFAHLTGVGSNARAETDEEKKDPAERDHEDGNVKKGKKAEDKKDCPAAENDDGTEDKEASGDDLPESDDGDGDDDGDKKGKKAKKAKADKQDGDGADEDEDDKEDREVEMRGNSPAAQARRREQARCAAIFASPAAGKNPALAANLAFKTRMTRQEALVVLESTPAAAGPGNAARAARNPNVGSGASGSPTSAQAVASSWDRTFAKVNGRSAH